MTSRWIICTRCHGDGQHSHDLGAFTSSDWEQEDDEFRERYMRGDYDRPCERCDGTGKVRAAVAACGVCGEEGRETFECCVTDEFPEPGELRELGVY